MPSSPRSALVTGSTSGIGAATVRRLAADGWHVVVSGRDADRGRDVVEAIERAGGTARFVAGDLAGPAAQLRSFARSALEAADGHIELLVHNAAVCPPVDTLTLRDDDLEQALGVNVRAPQVLTAALVPVMIERGGGGIIVIGSWMAQIGHPFVGLYAATKAAEAQLARSWAAEFGPHGIRVNTVAPGVIRSPADAEIDEVARAMTDPTPAGRPGTPAEIADVVAWLASDGAAYIHGATIPVDGGITSTRLR